ncbi:hypothetical protein EVAR_36169_1 [Eumeta japonica]|uniref:Uncharacterized protein n=1 Tax=Eumeta variegata TaxID=151549 RepID=A0A4C1VU93_EUMVA|nr:hypothetical protein EVAR_36169_1 [Eumeta japonica]
MHLLLNAACERICTLMLGPQHVKVVRTCPKSSPGISGAFGTAACCLELRSSINSSKVEKVARKAECTDDDQINNILKPKHITPAQSYTEKRISCLESQLNVEITARDRGLGEILCRIGADVEWADVDDVTILNNRPEATPIIRDVPVADSLSE